jgi:hypothetical protein
MFQNIGCKGDENVFQGNESIFTELSSVRLNFCFSFYLKIYKSKFPQHMSCPEDFGKSV